MTDSTRVLVVDDNEINAMLAEQLIKAFSLECITVDSGEKAIEAVRNNTFAFVLMDHIMPGMDGVEATGIIKSFSDVPIYAMTGDLTAEVAAEFNKAGAVSAISKPLNARDFLKIISDCVPKGRYEFDPAIFEAPVNSGMNGDNSEGAILRSYLSAVSGLDYEKGLRNALGNEKSYLRLLKASAGNIREYVVILEDYLRSAEPSQLKLASHSLKTVFANIGVESLLRESEKVEAIATDILKDSADDNAILSFDERYQDMMNDYISHVMNLALELEDALSAYENAAASVSGTVDYSVPEVELSEEDLAEVMEYTLSALERFEIDYLLEGLEHLKKARCGEERKKIEAAIEAANNFDYDTVREYIS